MKINIRKEEKLKIMKQDLVNEKTLKQKVKEICYSEYDELLSKILIIDEKTFQSIFLNNIKEQIELIYTDSAFSNKHIVYYYEQYIKLINKNYYNPDFKINNKAWSEYQANVQAVKNLNPRLVKKNAECFSYLENYFYHCNDCISKPALHTCGEKLLLVFNDTGTSNSSTINTNSAALFVICVGCKYVYTKDSILLKCPTCVKNYYSKILTKQEKESDLPATWEKYHCNTLIKDPIKCIKCNEIFYMNKENNLLKCKACKFEIKPLSIAWICIVCKYEFKSNIKPYCSIQFKIVKDAIKNALLLKEPCKPLSVPCCSLNIDKTEFIHKKDCNGILFKGDLFDQSIVVCEKCRAMNYYEKFIWTCPVCFKKFRQKQKENEDEVLMKERTCSMSNYLSVKINQKNSIAFNLPINENDEDMRRVKLNESKSNNNLDILKTKNQSCNSNFSYVVENDLSNNESNTNSNKSLNAVEYDNPNNNENIKSCSNNNSLSINNSDNTNKATSTVISKSSPKNKLNYSHTITDASSCDINKNIDLKTNYPNKYFHAESLVDFNARKITSSSVFLSAQKSGNAVLKKAKNLIDILEERKLEKNNQNSHSRNANYSEIKNYKSINIDVSEFSGNLNNNENENGNRIKNLNNEDKVFKSLNNVFEGVNINKNKVNVEDENKEESHHDKNEYINITESIKLNKDKNLGILKKRMPAQSVDYAFLEEDKTMNIGIHKASKDNDSKKVDPYKCRIVESETNSPIKKNKEEIEKKKEINYSLSIQKIGDLDKEDSTNKKTINKSICSPITSNTKNNIALTKSPEVCLNNKNEKNHLSKDYNNISVVKIQDKIKLNDKNESNKKEMKENILNTNNTNTTASVDNISKPTKNKETKINISPSKQKPEANEKKAEPEIKENIIQKEKEETLVKEPECKDYILDINQYKIISQIGEGTYGKIYKVSNKLNKKFAMKKIICHNKRELQYTKTEFEIVMKNSHNNIARIEGMAEKELDETTFALYILLELADSDWEIEVSKRHKFLRYYKEYEIIDILKQLVSCLSFLQKKKISHRDIKPQNILVFGSSCYKLADFGEAKQSLINRQVSTLRGTELYMSPILFEKLKEEAMNKQNPTAPQAVKHNTFKSDMFSLGYCIIYAATLTFDSIASLREIDNKKDIEKILRNWFRRRYSDIFISMILKMIDLDEKSRFDFFQLEEFLENCKFLQ